MKTSIVFATLVVVGAGAVGAGATFATQPYSGSDTLYDLTNGAIAASLLGNSGDYQGGGSGAGENAMTAASPVQHTAPMSKMMTKQTCTVAGAAYTHASGIAIGLDAVDIYSATAAGATAACNGTADNAGTGLTFSSASTANGGPYANWTDMLALLYGGMDKSSSFCVGGTAAAGTVCSPQATPAQITATCGTGGSCTPLVDCNSTKRQALVSHWSNLFQNGCANGVATCTTASLPVGAATTTINGQLWHAFRRDDNSGTSDAFASLIGLGQLTDTKGVKTITANVSSSANAGYGATPYCNALNWDNTAANASCALGTHKQYVGPGGVIDTVANDGVHRRPPVGAWGDNPDASTSTFGAAALPTSFQDNDPIRVPCIGRKTFVQNTSNPAEEVCNLDGKLGIVIPIPAVDFIPRQNPTGGIAGAARTAYNTQLCNGFVSSNAFTVFKCTQRSPATTATQCPNGDKLFGGGCFAPQNTTQSTTLCENNPSHWPSLGTNPAADGRIYNLFVTDGAGGYTTTTVPSVPVTFAFSGAFARLHSQLVMFDPANPGVNQGVTCQQGDATDQIGCLTQADPCSVGFAGDGAKTWGNRASPVVASGNDAIRVNQVYPTAATVQSGSYDLWRKVYFNSSAGFDQAVLANNAELALGQYESNTATMTSLLGTYGFFGFGASPNGGGNAPFCEDFNEQLIGTSGTNSCNGVASNANACNLNASIQQPSANTAIPGATLGATSPIPSDPSAVATASTTSTVCGNGKVEAFEDCDNGTPGVAGAINGGNGSTGNNCSITCRTVFP
jgi:hypothetical protein